MNHFHSHSNCKLFDKTLDFAFYDSSDKLQTEEFITLITIKSLLNYN